MPEFIFTMQNVTRVHPPEKRVLEDITLAFYPGAKIGVIGTNGSSGFGTERLRSRLACK